MLLRSPREPFAQLPYRHYRTIAIDPPWKFSGGTKNRPQHYPRMTDAEIAALPIRDLAHPDGCNILLWITSPKMETAFKVARSWRCRHSGRAFVWVKTHPREANTLFLHHDSLHVSTGFTTRKNAEDVLFFKFGKPRRMAADVHEIIIAPRREHSRKPDEFYRRAERLCAGPYLEIFGRESRPGWDVWGNEATKFDAAPIRRAA
jgi:N6-adenosine-specific RNA methylase IME4